MTTEMQYRRVGRAGIKLSALSFGTWVTFGRQLDGEGSLECMQAAWDAGVNFFDCAEVYANGEAETLLGEDLQQLEWARESYVISTKFFWGITEGPNTQNTLNRKYLMQAIDQSLERLQLDFVDLVYCHRADPDTPIEETVFAMHDMISAGKALYWGTSEWSADEIRAAWHIASENHLHKPVVEQPQYNLLNSERVDVEYARVFEDLGIGSTTWSPLASGLLTGKYLQGIPEDSRAAVPSMSWLADQLTDREANERVQRLVPIAKELDCSLAQLAIAWCLVNPNVSSVITGASRVSQVIENMAALEVFEAFNPEILERIRTAVSAV
jgi:voltage-dependent potassium channel beta subunit